MSKRVLATGAVLVVAATAILLLRDGGVPVITATATRDTLTVTVATDGITRARNRYTVVAPVTGRVSRLELEEGDSVAGGELLARIYPAPQDPAVVATLRSEVEATAARLRQAEAGVREAAMQADQARSEVERRRPLAEMGALSAERLEQAELAADVAQARLAATESVVASARASLESARARLQGAMSGTNPGEPMELRAAVSGRVAEVADRSERVVAAGTPLLTLVDTDGLEAVFDVLSEDAVRVAPGDAVVVTGWGGDGELKGRVRRVTRVGYTEISALGVEEQRVDIVADLVQPPPALGTGYRVSGEIVIWTGSDVLSVPTSALFRRDGSWQLFVVEEGRARLRRVELGHRNERAAEVTEGITAGEDVILFPSESVDDGTRVRSTRGEGA